jgi:hypothetical protein
MRHDDLAQIEYGATGGSLWDHVKVLPDVAVSARVHDLYQVEQKTQTDVHAGKLPERRFDPRRHVRQALHRLHGIPPSKAALRNDGPIVSLCM